ncbi:hypothetical protein PR048_028786 [Dryococelus australis]|uniref:Uncharacterized protein n=1 Tax=Dryococelus australis TaxID=614101 RepID=A0ABQ9GBZ2_9NEOP|nr:hypothetical protein PR048_028786 [Dryococelus australis]
MHKNALNILNKCASIQEFFVKTPVGKAMPSVSGETNQCIRKLVDIAYVLTQEEIAFNKFPKLVELEKRHGIDIGNTDYLICCDGSTDVSVTDKEIVFVMFINNDTSDVKFKYSKITDLPNSSASAIFNSLKEMLTEFGVKKKKKKKNMLVFWQMGVLVNFGHILGVYVELKKNYAHGCWQPIALAIASS